MQLIYSGGQRVLDYESRCFVNQTLILKALIRNATLSGNHTALSEGPGRAGGGVHNVHVCMATRGRRTRRLLVMNEAGAAIS